MEFNVIISRPITSSYFLALVAIIDFFKHIHMSCLNCFCAEITKKLWLITLIYNTRTYICHTYVIHFCLLSSSIQYNLSLQTYIQHTFTLYTYTYITYLTRLLYYNTPLISVVVPSVHVNIHRRHEITILPCIYKKK